MNVAFIPVRGGSKSIPLKNIRPIAGKPLVYWTVRAACLSDKIDKVFIATDSEAIREAVERFANNEKAVFAKAEVIGRSAESASDTASTESAMLEFADEREFDNIALIQATSPLLTAEDLNRGFAAYEEPGTDSVLSVVRQKRFIWADGEDGYAHPANYDVFHRPRRQEFNGYAVENGAFYITSRESLLSSKNRVSGHMRVVEMDEACFFEIDEPSDWIIIDSLMRKREKPSTSATPQIKLFLTDCDGCLTDGGMYYSEQGDELKKYNTKDGMAFQLLHENGILTGMITGESVALNQRRANKLKLDYYEAGCTDKLKAIKRICAEHEIGLENVCYIGDDVNDLEAIRAVGFGCCPADAVALVREVADYVSSVKGGSGVIRDVTEVILKGVKEQCLL